MHKNAISFFRVSKAMLVLFSLAFFLFAPSIDGIACDDCASPFQGKWSDAPHFCSFCLNSVGIVSSHFSIVPLTSIPFDPERPKVSFLDPTFSIDRPPKI